MFQLKKKKLEARSKLENLEDLEKIIQLKKKKRCKKVKVPVLKKPEPEVIVSYFKVPYSGKALMGVCATHIHALYILSIRQDLWISPHSSKLHWRISCQ